MGIYPKGWPQCPNCGQPALSGHITCGSFNCDEHGTRRRQDSRRAAEAEQWSKDADRVDGYDRDDTGESPDF